MCKYLSQELRPVLALFLPPHEYFIIQPQQFTYVKLKVCDNSRDAISRH